MTKVAFVRALVLMAVYFDDCAVICALCNVRSVAQHNEPTVSATHDSSYGSQFAAVCPSFFCDTSV